MPIGSSPLLWPHPKARAPPAHVLAPQVLSTRILAMKASLCKLSPCTVTRVCDYHAKLFLIAISSTLKSLLRPNELNTPDKSPGDRLTEICAKITDVGGSSSTLQATLGSHPHPPSALAVCQGGSLRCLACAALPPPPLVGTHGGCC